MTRSGASAHTASTLQTWKRLQELKSGKNKIVLDGNGLDIASVIAAARFGVKPEISKDEGIVTRLQLAVDALAAYLSKQWIVYGVNTGFGGSADTRTSDLVDLQISVLQHTQSAIITSLDKSPANNSEREPSHVLPLEWVRGAILARANQNLRGHSAIHLDVLQNLVQLLHRDITPLVPLRGTISASGDLMPMSYIAGAITGNRDIFVQMGKGRESKVLSSAEALRLAGLSPTRLGPKEALGLINGTAPSVSAGSIVLYDSQRLAYLSQMLTAFASEAMGGNVEWTDPFIHACRPHAGQIEAASNIRSFLQGSRLVEGLDEKKRTGDGLWQDRYSTRTSPQWIGPYLEDLLLAQRQIEVELNSTSDNPLVNASTGEVYSGGNFQAVAVTSAMDKTRLALQMIGRMLFSQVTEMISPSMNNGLEANLNASDREHCTMKGIDVNVAAYMSELAALAHPVSSHVMSAEMHNQGINSLAMLAARQTADAVRLLEHICACHLYVSCQAVDLRASHKLFLETLRQKLLHDTILSDSLIDLGLRAVQRKRLAETLQPIIETTWYQHNSNTWRDRIEPVVEAIMVPVSRYLVSEDIDCPLSKLHKFGELFTQTLTEIAEQSFYPGVTVNPSFVAAQLGVGTSQLYTWVRSELDVPTHFGIYDDPLYTARQGLPTDSKKTSGSWVSLIYESLKGPCLDMVMERMGSQKP